MPAVFPQRLYLGGLCVGLVGLYTDPSLSGWLLAGLVLAFFPFQPFCLVLYLPFATYLQHAFCLYCTFTLLACLPLHLAIPAFLALVGPDRQLLPLHCPYAWRSHALPCGSLAWQPTTHATQPSALPPHQPPALLPCLYAFILPQPSHTQPLTYYVCSHYLVHSAQRPTPAFSLPCIHAPSVAL